MLRRTSSGLFAVYRQATPLARDASMSHFESILLALSAEHAGDLKDELAVAFRAAIALFMEDPSIFQELPKSVSVEMHELRVETSDSETGAASVEFFEGRAVLIYDGLHASAFGHMRYIYRAKGIRMYLFQDGRIIIVSPYCTIDAEGFHYTNEVIDEFNWKETIGAGDLAQLFAYVDHEREFGPRKPGDSRKIIRMLCNVKCTFKKAYFLEYLVTPPDVDSLSAFSLRMRHSLWSACFSEEFRTERGRLAQNACMNVLSEEQVAPSAGQIAYFINAVAGEGGLAEIQTRLSQITAHIVEPHPSPINRQVRPVHFEDFSGKDFERMVYAYVVRTGWLNPEWLGETGSDGGCDILCHGVDGSTAVFLCANYRILTLQKVVSDLTKISAISPTPSQVFVVAGGSVSKNLRDKVRLKAIELGLAKCIVWAGAELEENLRAKAPELLERFVYGQPFPSESGSKPTVV